MNTEQTRTARKRHTCDWCGAPISPGTRYVMTSKPAGGNWTTERMHTSCRLDAITPEDDYDGTDDDQEAREWAREQGFDFDTGLPRYGEI